MARPQHPERDRPEVIPVGLEALSEQVTVAHGHILWFAAVILLTRHTGSM
jgi:hypothetical protein